jgi:hypothetical protein
MKIAKMMIVIVSAVVMFGCVSPQSVTVSGTALLIPNRYTIVELAFNIREFRPVELLIFDSARTNLYVWNTQERKWLKTTAEDINLIPEVELNKIIVIGPERDIPNTCVNSLKKPGVQVERIDSYDFKTLFNELNRHFKFSLSEWEFFAKTYELTLEDRNAERRRWGKYGKPGSPKPLKQLHPVVMPEQSEQPKTSPTSPAVSPATGARQEAVLPQEKIKPASGIFIPPSASAKEEKQVKKPEDK